MKNIHTGNTNVASCCRLNSQDSMSIIFVNTNLLMLFGETIAVVTNAKVPSVGGVLSSLFVKAGK
jgi:hypothetical protein